MDGAGPQSGPIKTKPTVVLVAPALVYSFRVHLRICSVTQNDESYDVSFKLKAIESVESTSKEAAAHRFGVEPRRKERKKGKEDDEQNE